MDGFNKISENVMFYIVTNDKYNWMLKRKHLVTELCRATKWQRYASCQNVTASNIDYVSRLSVTFVDWEKVAIVIRSNITHKVYATSHLDRNWESLQESCNEQGYKLMNIISNEHQDRVAAPSMICILLSFCQSTASTSCKHDWKLILRTKMLLNMLVDIIHLCRVFPRAFLRSPLLLTRYRRKQ